MAILYLICKNFRRFQNFTQIFVTEIHTRETLYGNFALRGRPRKKISANLLILSSRRTIFYPKSISIMILKYKFSRPSSRVRVLGHFSLSTHIRPVF